MVWFLPHERHKISLQLQRELITSTQQKSPKKLLLFVATHNPSAWLSGMKCVSGKREELYLKGGTYGREGPSVEQSHLTC